MVKKKRANSLQPLYMTSIEVDLEGGRSSRVVTSNNVISLRGGRRGSLILPCILQRGANRECPALLIVCCCKYCRATYKL